MIANRDAVDFQFRIYLLTLLDGRERSFKEIYSTVSRNYTAKKFTKQRIQIILNKLVRQHCLSKNKHETTLEDRSKYSYVIISRGRERLDYYKKRLAEKNGP